MYPADTFSGQVPVVAIVGAGASGTLAAVQLLRQAGRQGLPLHVALIDRHGRHGRGQAYSTSHPAHLLNTPAAGMSAVPGSPDHLVQWARDKEIGYEGFLPRSAYGDYLSELLAAEERRAQPTARVARLTSQVVAIRRGCGPRALRLDLAAEGRVDADAVILATGNLPPGGPVAGVQSSRVIADPWAPGALRLAGNGGRVVVVGSGLTMIDVAIALTSVNPNTTVHAVSRHGLWGDLPEPDKRVFLRHVARYWEVHRHRMPPATARQLDALLAAGRVTLQRGSVAGVQESEDGLRVAIQHGQSLTEMPAGWLINCTGPAADVTKARDPLVRSLLAQGIGRPDPLRLGLDADERGAVLDAHGHAAGDIFAIGPLLRGLRYETTAVPEIRDQAAVLARTLIAERARTGPRSAA